MSTTGNLFLRLFDRAPKIVPMRRLDYALLPNHFHLVLWRTAQSA
jgi:hypothetical protein